MIESPQNLKDQLLNLTETIATEMKTLRENKLGKNDKAVDAGLADKAKADSQGNEITSTYATKSEVNSKAPKDNPIFSGTVTANTFSGELSGNAYSAARDQNGNIISSTYATKIELGNKLGKLENAVSATSATNDSLGRKIDETYITKVGNRGQLAGHETVSVVSGLQTINGSSPDTMIIKTSGATTLTFTPMAEGENAVKEIALHANATTTLTCNGAIWANKGTAPKWGTGGKNLVLVANFIGGRVILSVSDNDE